MTTSPGRPTREEYAPYYHTYVSKVPDGEIVELLVAQRAEIGTFLGSIDPSRGTYRYAPEKWSVNEVLGHCIDVERVFTTRALAFARRDPAALPGIEQDDYVAGADFDARSLADLVAELDAVRGSTLAFFAGLERAAWTRAGVASGTRMSVRAVAHVIHGHLGHHAGVLRERYLRA